jgi:hypothetical protein
VRSPFFFLIAAPHPFDAGCATFLPQSLLPEKQMQRKPTEPAAIAAMPAPF